MSGKFRRGKWEDLKDSTPRHDNQLRCSQGEKRELGSKLWGDIDRRRVVPGREIALHQYPRAESCLTRLGSLCSGIYITCNRRPNYGVDQEEVEARFDIFEMTNPNEEHLASPTGWMSTHLTYYFG